MDCLIHGGMIVDGTGRPPYEGDILIRRDEIAAIGQVDAPEGIWRVDARGLVVTPGLIDAHTHADLALMQNRQQPNALYQGISTMVVGQCGLGFAPVVEHDLENAIQMNSGIFGRLPGNCPRWRSFSEFLGLLDGCAVNVGAMVPHNAVRQIACGYQNTPLTGAQLEAALAALDEALSEGALGLSVGLSYYPGGYGDTGELIELCRAVQRRDALFCVHMRLDVNNPDFRPMDEIARVAEETRVRTNMLHHRTGGFEPHTDVTAPFERAAKAGAEVTFEFYPYLVGSGLVLAVVPDWAQEGGPDEILKRLESKSLRPRLMKDLKHRFGFFFPNGATGRIYLTRDPYSPDRGRTIDEIAQEHGEAPWETAVRLLIENRLEVGFNGVEFKSPELQEKLYDDQYRLFLDERYTVGSDSIPSGGLSHPRTSGAFARIIAQMRKRGVPMETVIRKLSAKPAEIYRLSDRGVLLPGKKADICLMDYDRVEDGADEGFSRRKPEGIVTLFVNGLPVMREGTLTGELSGHALKRGKSTPLGAEA